ncbi:MAG: PmeII family type II restriction endonuclease [Chloroflexota bacterium]
MRALNLEEVRMYVNNNIDIFHRRRIELVSSTTLKDLIDKNPYLLKAKNVATSAELVDGALSARLSSSEEEEFGKFLESLAVFVARKTTGGHKSGATGIDLEFDHKKCHYFISIKSGPNWGNSSQHKTLDRNLQSAVNVYRQDKGQNTRADSVLGICYGKVRTARNKAGYLKLVGQNFWTFISGNQNLYKEIIEPIGFKAKEHNDNYYVALGGLKNKLSAQFTKEFCREEDGLINWDLLVEATCSNYDLDRHGFAF